MKNIVLAAGYATRLFPVTENFPKPLLEIGGVSILDRLIRDLDAINEIDEHVIVCNHSFLPHFVKWNESSCYTKKITLVDDGSTTNENRLGAVRDLLLAIETKQLVDDDLLVIAADNVLTFSLHDFIDFFYKKQTSVIMHYYEPELKALQRTGVISVDKNMQVLDMQEKPQNPKSNYAVPPFYVYKKSDIKLIKNCILEDGLMDAPGNLVKSMLGKTTFHTWEMTGKRYDIGTLETYNNLKNSPL